MINLMSNTLPELTANIEKMGEPKYRASQLYTAMHNGLELNEITNLPKSLIAKLTEQGYSLQTTKIIKKRVSKDKTVKYLMKLEDGNIVETILMRYKYGNTICISTQVGCKMNCAFCASGLNGFVRNLTAGEILGQVVAVNRELGGTIKKREITNIVLMGIGEPLDNYDNVVRFLGLVTDKNGLNIGVRNISLSTCGIPSKIEKLADEGYAITLCISLHASNNETRKQIMPIAKRYSIESVLESAKHYHTITNRRIIIEYTLIKGVNSSIANAKELAGLLQGLPCHVNLIRLNEVPERGLKGVSETEMNNFLGVLCQHKVSATIRRRIGDDISGACGQLRNSEEKRS